MRIEEKILLDEIRKKNRAVFEKLFDEYFIVLVHFAEGFLFDLPASEDIVQNFFINFWCDAKNKMVNTSLKSYFFKSIQNLCLNRLREINVYDKHKVLYIEAMINANNCEPSDDHNDLLRIQKGIKNLPSQMAEIFRQKYFEGKRINNIAIELGTTEGTVKTQLHRARNLIRSMLKNSI